MKFKFSLLVIYILCLSTYSFAQGDERPLYSDKKTIYSKLSGHEGSNIDITLLIYSNDKKKLVIGAYKNDTMLEKTLDIHELNFLPIQNLITQTLIREYNIGATNQTAQDILESQSLSTINMLVLAGQAFLTSFNNVDRNNITSSFSFKVKIPIFIDADSDNINTLFKLVDFAPPIIPKDTLVKIKDSLKLLYNELISLEKTTDTTKRNLTISKIDTLIKSKEYYKIMFGNKKTTKYLVGYASVDKNEFVINNYGFGKAMKITLYDSLELRHRFGVRKFL